MLGLLERKGPPQDIRFESLVEVVFTRFLCCEDTSPFVTANSMWGDTLGPCGHPNFPPNLSPSGFGVHRRSVPESDGCTW